jgi:hypothetical protein
LELGAWNLKLPAGKNKLSPGPILGNLPAPMQQVNLGIIGGGTVGGGVFQAVQRN